MHAKIDKEILLTHVFCFGKTVTFFCSEILPSLDKGIHGIERVSKKEVEKCLLEGGILL